MDKGKIPFSPITLYHLQWETCPWLMRTGVGPSPHQLQHLGKKVLHSLRGLAPTLEQHSRDDPVGGLDLAGHKGVSMAELTLPLICYV